MTRDELHDELGRRMAQLRENPDGARMRVWMFDNRADILSALTALAPADAQRVDEIEARAKAATKGPWIAVGGDDEYCSSISGVLSQAEADRVKAHDGRGDFPENTQWVKVDAGCAPVTGTPEDNDEFIAHARTDIPYLIGLVRARGEGEVGK